MKLDYKQLLETAGVVTVVLSLIFVALEIQQNNKISNATLEYELRRDYAELNELRLEDNQFLEFIVKMEDPRYEMSVLEQERAESLVRRIGNTWNATHKAYSLDLLSDDSYNGLITNEIPRVISKYPALLPIFKEVWDYPQNRYYPSELGEYVHEVIAENDNK